MLPSIVSQGWLMVKLDLKDAYLTIPMAKESWNLLAFQAGPSHKLMQFHSGFAPHHSPSRKPQNQ